MGINAVMMLQRACSDPSILLSITCYVFCEFYGRVIFKFVIRNGPNPDSVTIQGQCIFKIMFINYHILTVKTRDKCIVIKTLFGQPKIRQLSNNYYILSG